MVKYNPYPDYEPSGIDWLGDVPKHWNVKKIKHTTYVKGRIGWKGLKAEEFCDEGPYCVTGTDFNKGKIDWSNSYHISQERYEEDPYIQLINDDLLITKDGSIGKIALVKDLKGQACLNSGIFVTRPLRDDYNTEFMYWLLNSDVFANFINYMKDGSTIEHLYQNVFEVFSFPVPSISEQNAIVDFLDCETAKIDTLIEKTEKLIKRLQEKRTALISHAVTKGLNPNVELKPSGIDWLGDVPKHWEIKRLRFLCDLNPAKSELSNYSSDLEVSFLPMELVSEDGVLCLDDTKALHSVYNGYTYFRDNDVLVAKITPCFENGKGGLCAKLTNGIGFGTTEFHVLRAKWILDNKFLFYLTKSYLFRNTGTAMMKGTAGQKRVPELFIKDFFIGVPSIQEQGDIVNYIFTETAKLDTLIDKNRRLIKKLTEKRTALISAAVTGKIDVRDN